MSNHLIIGLGGTGGKIIRAFRKIIFQEFRKTDPDDVNIGYLHVDSDEGMMAPDDPSWKILGRLVQLGKNQQVCIQGANLHQHLNNINSFPGIKPWIGNREQWNDILKSFQGVNILGGQKRRLGRFLLACHVDNFVNQLTLQISELQRMSQKSDVTLHVCCGLAGGTGSGIILDVLAQIRKHFPYSEENGHFRLIAYTLLPEKNPKPGWNTGNYHANGYAALLELNALSAGQFVPYDISVGGRIKSNSVMFNGLYLFSNQNERGNVLDVEEQVPEMMADFLYQKIVAVRNIAWEDLRKSENMENGDSTPEIAPIPGSKIPERAKRFLAFGIKRVAIPDEEIKEYLSYHFARQVVLHLKFNNWDETAGFTERAKPKDFHSFVAEKATQSEWLLSDEHLCLSKAILQQDINKNWETIDEDWQKVVPNFTSTVRDHSPKKNWLERLPKLFETRFDNQFRSGKRGEVGGVKKFYELKQEALSQMAKEIRHKIEETLFTDWRNGVKSVHEIVTLGDALIKSLDKRRKEISAKILQREKEAKSARDKIAEVNQKWGKAWIGKIFSANNMLDQQAANLCDLYIAQTWVEALAFSEKLTDVVLEELRRFQTDLVKSMNIVTKAVEEFDKMLAQRIRDNTKADITKQLVRFYDPNAVKAITNQLISNEQIQKNCATEVRFQVVSKMGQNPDFSTFAQLDISTFIDTVVIQSEQNAQMEHDRHVESAKRLVGVSIIEKLKGEYENDQQALQLYVNDLVEHACNYLSFNTAELNRQGVGIPNSPNMSSLFTVVLPQAPEHQRFLTTLKEAFRSAYTGDVKFLHSDNKPNEIAMVNITNLFPLRFVDMVSFLRDKYLARIDNTEDSLRTKLEIHTEDSDFPSLFVPSSDEMEKEAIPYLLLAKSMDLIVQLDNPKTGSKQFAFMQHDNVDVLPPINLGKTFIDSFKELNDLVLLEAIKRRVNNLLETDYLHRKKRDDLVNAMLEEVGRIRQEECGNDLEDPIYKQFYEGRKAAVEILNRG
ncbi:tubulin-like doman-containing protein [Candidatus Parabeggiatoa sp. HSG14]|uniref:tubulin-like doman-containing protein n=1 Tax=Candidatus Parabeggiatoa sp. HSG14 TaxID=3055593 RepID=UPI0025A87C7D|nr:tubulin-like doman-containing protein [Thiotrichales bacterium HSG14]